MTVQALDYAQLRARLLAQHQVLDLPVLSPLPTKPSPSGKGAGLSPAYLPGLILDDAQATLTGDWAASANFKPHVGKGYIHDEHRSDGKSAATFRFQAPGDGEFALRMAYSAHETRTTRLPVTLSDGTATQSFVVDQTIPLPAGDFFRTIGTVRLRRGVDYVLQLANKDTVGFVIVDAFQLLPADAKTGSPAEAKTSK